MSTCRTCEAPVVRLVHETSGGRAPIDAAPAEDGNIRLLAGRGQYQVLTGEALAQARRDGEPLHKNHFATCPDAEQWRGKGQPKRAR